MFPSDIVVTASILESLQSLASLLPGLLLVAGGGFFCGRTGVGARVGGGVVVLLPYRFCRNSLGMCKNHASLTSVCACISELPEWLVHHRNVNEI